MSDELIAPESEKDFQEIQTNEHVRPVSVFKGQELRPYSRGTRILYNMVLSDNDLLIYRILAFIYIHSRPLKETIRLARSDVDGFFEKVMEFRDTLTDQECEEAQKIVEQELTADMNTQVIPEPDDDGKKKDDAA